MKKRGFFIFLGIISTLLLLVGCADNDNSSSKAEAKGTNDSEDTLLVVTTYSIIYDIIKKKTILKLRMTSPSCLMK